MSESGAQLGVTSPPAGTGHVPGLGEAFNINLNTGQGVYSYKLPLPDGVAGHTPHLGLEYAHGAGLGVFGLGWRLPIRSISRRLDFSVPAEGVVERFMDSGVEIFPLADGSFGPMVETTFTRYTRSGDGWKIEERNGVVHELGLHPQARIVDPDHPTRVHEWLLERSLDTSGNTIEYSYLPLDEGIPYVSEIRYATYAVRFIYGARPDVRIDGRTGFLRKRAERCERVELYFDPGPEERLIRSWAFFYDTEPLSGTSLLASIQMVSHGFAADGSEDVRRPPTTFRYSPFEPQRYEVTYTEASDGAQPPPLTEADLALVTLDNAPLPGILQIVNGRQYYWRNRGDGTWSHPAPVPSTSEVSSFAREGVAFIDVDSSGTADLVTAGGGALQGYYENGGREGWSRFVLYPRGRRVSPAWTSESIRLTDSDGDGRIDAIMSNHRAFVVWLNQGEQGWADPLLAPKGGGDDRPDVDLADPTVHLADMTGDGLQDLVRVRSGRVEYWPSLGHGRFGNRVVMDRSPRLRDLQRAPENLSLIDVDGDGCADLVRVSASGVELFVNRNGASFAEPVILDTVPPPIPGTMRPVDMKGTGRSGLLWNSYRGRHIGYVYLEFGPPHPPYLLSTIENGAGLISEISYRPAIEDFLRDLQNREVWHTNFPFPLLVVAGTKETDQVSGQVAETSYRYHEGHYEPHTRQFQGFRRTERIEKGDESRADTLTVFRHLMAQERLPGNGPEHVALNGMLERTEVYSLDGSVDEVRPYRVEEAVYDLKIFDESVDGDKRTFLFVTTHRTEDSDRTDDVRGEEKTYAYDDVGNVVRERHRGFGTRGGVVQDERVRTTEVEYASSAERWLIDKPARTVVRDEAGTIILETRRYYDGADFVGLPLGQAERGLLTREEQLVLPEADFLVHYEGMDIGALGYSSAPDADGVPAIFVNKERHAYDARGLRQADRDALGHDSIYEYDTGGLFRTKLIDTLGETRFEYDRATGQPTVITYSDGSQVRVSYDAQGRIGSVALPGEPVDKPSRVLFYDDASIPNSRTIRFRNSNATDGSSVAITYFDGRGGEFQQRIEADEGRFVVSGLGLKNPWNDVKQEYEPGFSNEAAFSLPPTTDRPHREMYYDARGRIVKAVNYNGGVSTAEYRPFEVITRDANDNDESAENKARGQFDTPRREEFDVFRHQTKTVEMLGGDEEVATFYRPGPMGELLETKDDRGTMCTYQNDRLGNRLRTQHREAGQRRIWYDARQQAVRTLDAGGNDIRAEIDERGRLKRLAVGGAVVEEYTYDDVDRNALGRLAEVRYSGGRQVFNYDVSGKLVLHEYHFDDQPTSFTLEYEYDGLGREIAVTHTDGTKISKELTPNGWVRAIPGFLDKVEYDPRGLPVKLLYANGVSTETTYTEGPGKVKSQKTRGPSGQVLEELSYEYDKLEMLLGSNDVAPGGIGSRLFAYDPLYQIKGVTTIEAGAPVTRAYEYTDNYNLTRFEEAGSFLHYDDASHPDRVAGITPSGGTRFHLRHDDNGNLLILPGKTFHYNFKNELERFEADSGLVATYRYDYRGQRISKTVDDGQGSTVRTLFLGDLAEIRDGQPTYFVRVGHQRVGIISSGTTHFVHGDYLGSTAFFSDATGTKIGAIRYLPFGNLASSSGKVDVRTYGVHPFDAESGLYYMKRRYYAPEIGRFLTPDPIAVYQSTEYLHNPKALHPYIYVANDPLNNVDPAGLSFWSVVGAIAGVAVGVVVGLALVSLAVVAGGTFGWVGLLLFGVIVLALAFGVMSVAYAVTSKYANTPFGEFMRGFLVGMNAGLNATIATALFGPFGLGIGIALGVINFLAAFDTIAHSSVYQGVLGWSSWLMPMSWLATGVGLAFFVINVAAWYGSFKQWDAAKIDNISMDWGTGTIVMEGGWISPARGAGGFNLGNFVFLESGKGAILAHETGHTLNVAAFGAIFHYVGAIDENYVQSIDYQAYAEQLAESHGRARGHPIIPMWI